MLVAFRRLPWRTAQRCSIISCRRNIAFSVARQAEVEPQTVEPSEELQLEEGDEERENESNSAVMLETFLQTVGEQFKTPQKPNNWLGNDKVSYIFDTPLSRYLLDMESQPFPLNHSFKPPLPIPDELRTSLYRQFMMDPEKNSVRVLAASNHLSMKRVDAILRLKGLEEHWKQVRTHFILMTRFHGGDYDEDISISL
jgi:hypothetical protein